MEIKNKNKIIIIIVSVLALLLGIALYFLIGDKTRIKNNNDTYAKKIYFYKSELGFVESSDIKPDNSEILNEYKCKTFSCRTYYSERGTNSYSSLGLIIYDGAYYLYNYITNTTKKLNLPNANYSDEIMIIVDKNGEAVLLELDIKNDEKRNGLYDIKNNKMLIDYGEDYLSFEQNSNKDLLLVSYRSEKASLINLDNSRTICEFNPYKNLDNVLSGEYSYDWELLDNKKQTFVVGYIEGACTNCASSIYEIYLSNGKAIYESKKISENGELFINTALLKEDKLIISEESGNSSLFYTYDLNGKLLSTSKKYDDVNLVPVFNLTKTVDNNNYSSVVVVDSGNINIIDFNENVISTIDSINSKSVYTDYDNEKNIIVIYTRDKKLKLDDFTDDELKKLKTTKEEVLEAYNSFDVSYGYIYEYNTKTKEIKKEKNIYYDI